MAFRSRYYLGIATALGVAMLGVSPGHAQVVTTLEQAELAGLSPEVHAEVEARM